MKNDRIEDITLWPIDMPITAPFIVAMGTRVVAENVFVRITLSNRNIKIVKTGVLEAAEIASFTLKVRLKRMIGGMLESHTPWAVRSAWSWA